MTGLKASLNVNLCPKWQVNKVITKRANKIITQCPDPIMKTPFKVISINFFGFPIKLTLEEAYGMCCQMTSKFPKICLHAYIFFFKLMVIVTCLGKVMLI